MILVAFVIFVVLAWVALWAGCRATADGQRPLDGVVDAERRAAVDRDLRAQGAACVVAPQRERGGA